MNGIKFDDYDTYANFSLVLNSKEIETPEIKENLIDIPGANGYLDLSEVLGGVKYKNRKLILDFTFVPGVAYSIMITMHSLIATALHGRKMKIQFPNNTAYYFYGRVNVGALVTEKGIGTVRIECDCDPFKYEATETTISQTFQGGYNFILSNDVMPVVPSIQCNQALSFQFRENVYSHSAGTFQIPEIELREGQNNIYVYASDSSTVATCTFTFREGRL